MPPGPQEGGFVQSHQDRCGGRRAEDAEQRRRMEAVVNEPGGARHVLLCEPAATPARPLLAMLLLEPTEAMRGFWREARFDELRLAELLPRYLRTQLFGALLENQASEQGASMTAMDNATRNAGELINKLTIQYNRSRQAAITTELIEIIAGAEAL